MCPGSASGKFPRRILIVLQKSIPPHRNRVVNDCRINFDIFIQSYKYYISYPQIRSDLKDGLIQ